MHRATDLDEGGAGCRREAAPSEGRPAVAHDAGHRGEGLDVVDHGGLVEETALGRPRRPLVGLGPLVLERSEQHGLLAKDERAGKLADLHVQVIPGAQDVRAQVAPCLGLSKGVAQPAHGERARCLDRQVRLVGTHGIGRQGQALQDGVRVPLHERPVQLRSGVGLEPVGDGVAHGIGSSGARSPLLTRGVAGAAPAAQARLVDEAGDLFRTHPGDAARRHAAQPPCAAVEASVGSGAPSAERDSSIVGHPSAEGKDAHVQAGGPAGR